MAKVTVLTAVYNAESYLRQCLDSLKGQTLADCQFICIDDCSDDGSLQILQGYARTDARFEVLRTPVNSGQAVARNLGLQFARGEYVAMLDADDWFAPDTLAQAYHALTSQHATCAVLQLVQHFEDTGEEVLYPIRSPKAEWGGEEAFRLSLDWSLHGLYVVETTLHKRFPFDTTCRLYSDDNTTRLHYLHSSRVVLCQGTYFYRKHAASMTNACSVRRFDYMLANLSMKKQLQQLMVHNREELLDLYEQHRWLTVVACYRYYEQHRQAFAAPEHEEIVALFARILPTVEPSRLPWKLKLKPGYCYVGQYRWFSLMQRFYLMAHRVIRLFR